MGNHPIQLVISILLILIVPSCITLAQSVTSSNYNCRSTDTAIPVPSSFLPFGRQAGDEVLTGNFVEVRLNVGFPFAQANYDAVYVNADGVVSFQRPLSPNIPLSLPLSNLRVPILAPYMSAIGKGVNNGEVYFRRSSKPSDLGSARAMLVRYHRNIALGTLSNFQPSEMLVVTWRNVTFGGGTCTTPVNSYQLVMFTNGRYSFTYYLYGAITWTSSRQSGGTPNGLGGTPALVGYASGGPTYNFALNCSLQACIKTQVGGASNTPYPGVWGFRLDDNIIQDSGCLKDGPVAITNGIGPMLGGKPFQLTGPCLPRTTGIKCKVGSTVVPGKQVGTNSPNDVHRVECVPPLALETGQAPITLSLDDGRTYPFTANYMYVLRGPEFALRQVDPPLWEVADAEFEVTWDVTALPATEVQVEFLIIFPNGSDSVTTSTVPLAEVNTLGRPGYAKIPIGLPLIEAIPRLTSFGPLMVFDKNIPNNRTRTILYSAPEWSLWFFNQWYIELIYRTMNNVSFNSTAESDRDYSHLLPYLETPEATSALGSNPSRTTIARFMAQGGLNNFILPFFKRICGRWAREDGNPPPNFSGLPPVPCTKYEAERDNNFNHDPSCQSNGVCRFRPQAEYCVLAANPSAKDYGQRACYDSSGALIPPTDQLSTGSSQRYFPTKWFTNRFYDERGHAHCCVFSQTCETWAERRPAKTCIGYVFQSDDDDGLITISNGIGPVIGGKPFQLMGKPIGNSENLACKVGATVVSGKLLGRGTDNDPYKVQCVAPLALETGKVAVLLSTDGGRSYTSSTTYEYVQRDPEYALTQMDPPLWEIADTEGELKWDVKVLPATEVQVHFFAIFPNGNDTVTTFVVPLAEVNTHRQPGYAKLPIGLPLIETIPRLTSLGALGVFDNSQANDLDRPTLYTTPEWSLWFFNQWYIELIYRTMNNVPFNTTAESDRDYSHLLPHLETEEAQSALGSYPKRSTIASFMAQGGLNNFTLTFFKRLCGKWATADGNPPPDFSGLPAVPCTIMEALTDINYSPDPTCPERGRCRFRPKAEMCILANKPSNNGFGQRACYNSSGGLISPMDRLNTGNAQRYFPTKWFANSFFDERGHAHCCVFSQTCQTWAERRPAKTCDGYDDDRVSAASSTNSLSLIYLLLLAAVLRKYTST